MWPSDETGFTDASGTARLDVTTLGKLMGHEVGHYLGLSAQRPTRAGSCSPTPGVRGTTLTYDEYRTMSPHGFMVFL